MPVVQLNFEFKLPNGASSPFLLVAGGADLDGDGTVEDNEELGAFVRKGSDHVWTFQQALSRDVKGTIIFVQFTVGANVQYELTLKDGKGDLLFSNKNTTVSATENIRWRL